MQHSRTNWLFNLLRPGYFSILAFCLVLLSLGIFQASKLEQKAIIIGLLSYLGYLLFKKYRSLLLIAISFAAIFLAISFDQPTAETPNFNQQTSVSIYPDQVKVKDDWLTGIGKGKEGRFLLAGKITKEQKKIIQTGYPLLLSDFNGECARIDPATNLGEFNYQRFYEGKNIFYRIKFKSVKIMPKRLTFMAQLHLWRYQIKRYFQKMPDLLRFFTSELILAEDGETENEINDNYRDLGIIHLLSISGLHVGIYVLMISTFCYALKITEEQTFLICILFLLLEIFLSQGQAGFVRASLSYCLGTFFKIRKIKISGLDLLGLTCIIHLLLIPKLFMSSGAVLSYVLAMGLQITNNLGEFLKGALLNLLITPLMLFYFFQVNLLTIFFNMLAVPYFNFVVIPVVLLNLVLGAFIPDTQKLFEWLLELSENAIGSLAHTKLGLIAFGKINWWQCSLLLLCSILLLAALNNGKRNLGLSKRLGCGIAAGYFVLFIMIHFPLRGQVTFIDVGQGDSILITTPILRKIYLIDTGGKLNFSGKKITPQVNKITIPLLHAQGINQIDGLFVSHQDADHVGDIKPLMQQIHVKKLYLAKGLLQNPSFRKRVKEQAERTQFIELLAGMQVHEPKIDFQVVYPFHAGTGKNEDSLSITFKLAQKRWLFTGDLDQNGEKKISEKYHFQVDYFKLGHHGSKTASNPEFLKAIAPKMVFISAGRNNRFGHPHQETLSTLRSQRIPYVSTQDCGMISWYYGFGQSYFARFIKESNQ